jgi:predicted short-subunit dehydrogenase-like oxidoreductase (DUF2520 family)
MDIVLIGSGNVATALGRKSTEAGHRILQVYNRTPSSAGVLAAELGAQSVTDLSHLEKTADLTIISLRDDAVASAVQAMGNTRSVLVHTAGALSIESLKPAASAYGVLYPLQSLRKEIIPVPPLSILVDGNNVLTQSLLTEFSFTIADQVLQASDEVRLKYHLAATLVNNFTNYLFITAADFCKKENISFEALQPLMEETVNRLRYTAPAAAQTGPAWRNDRISLEKHRQLLGAYPEIFKLYEIFTAEIQRFASRANREPQGD